MGRHLAELDAFALKCIGLIAGGLVVLFVVVFALLRMRSTAVEAPKATNFLHDQNAAVAMAFALLLPIAIVIIFTIIQAALMFNANMVVNYAAYAATRTAIVWVPKPLGEEGQNLIMNPDYPDGEDSVKLQFIRRAAVLALIPISSKLPASPSESSPNGLPADEVLNQTRQALGRGDAPSPGWLRRVQDQYAYADYYSVTTLEQPGHWRDGNPHNDCPYGRRRTTGSWIFDQWSGWSEETEPFCPYFERRWDYAPTEALEITVDYQYELTIPYAKRVLGQLFTRTDGSRGYYVPIRADCSMTNEGLFELKTSG
jgi:hypothetical protein